MPRAIRYDRSPESLFFPGRADDFFPLGDAVSEAALCVEMARVAYVRHEDGEQEKGRLTRALERVGFRIHDLLDARGTAGLVADGPSREGGRLRVIAFRGTEPNDFRDTGADVDFRSHPWQGGATVHRGFARALGHVQDRVLRAVDAAPGPVCLAGHSLGAALATLVASLRPSARLYTVGSPRVGDAVFAKMISSERHQRYVDYVDAVTRVPPDGSGFGYVHTGPGHFIDEQGDIHPGLSDQEIRDRQGAAGGRAIGIVDLVRAFGSGRLPEEQGIPWRDLTDHAPINYVSAVMRLPA